MVWKVRVFCVDVLGFDIGVREGRGSKDRRGMIGWDGGC